MLRRPNLVVINNIVWTKYGFRLCRGMHLKTGIKAQQKSTTFASLPSIKLLPLKSSDLLEAWQKRSKAKYWLTFYAPASKRRSVQPAKLAKSVTCILSHAT